ncbi:MAG: glycine cleavage system aminomethyltransferase GcvT [Phycisphaerales bacterium]|nr:glycine cleavage system aminomethyltransferase GcvT [Phycisphaerales bacterium]
MATATDLKQTPFYDYHVQHGGKLVEYSGWAMPLHYGSIIEEHHQTRRSGGLFDVSHMGRLRFDGTDAVRFLDTMVTRNVHDMQVGQARYAIVCNEHGGCLDDVLVYRLSDTKCMVVCNAANRAKIVAHVEAIRGDMSFTMKDDTESTAMIAMQGPTVMALLSAFSTSIGELKRYRFIEKKVLLASVMISRTGYTGEDGVEVILPKMLARKAMQMMLANLDSEVPEIQPCGLGSRDSLRLEAGMALYGHEIDETIDPISAGLNFALNLDKPGGFIGQAALQKIAASGPVRTLVGLTLDTRRAARQGMAVKAGDTVVGTVTSGCLSPTLDASIAMALVDTAHAQAGGMLGVDLGRSTVEATVGALPFPWREAKG